MRSRQKLYTAWYKQKKLWTDSDQIWWGIWVCDNKNSFIFGENLVPIAVFFSKKIEAILHHWEMVSKHYKTWYLKMFGQNMTKFGGWVGRWQEQADSISVKVRIETRPISGIQNINCSAWRRYALYRVHAILLSQCFQMFISKIEHFVLFQITVFLLPPVPEWNSIFLKFSAF